MSQSGDCAFVLSVEQGPLEAQATLLVESLRLFGGAYANCPVVAVSPRPSRRIGAACRDRLHAFGAETVVESLTDANEPYGTVARLAACSWAERHLSSATLVGLDDDLFFAGEPDFSLAQGDLIARPVDLKGMATAGADDPFDPYWRSIAAICGVDYDAIPWLETTVDRIRIKASYNGGMIAARRSLGLFRTAQRMFGILRDAGLSPRSIDAEPVLASTGFVGAQASRWWGSAQAVLSLAATHLEACVRIAPPTYNIPIHLAPTWNDGGAAITLKDAVLVHYHWLLSKTSDLHVPRLPREADLPDSVRQWLASRTPLAG